MRTRVILKSILKYQKPISKKVIIPKTTKKKGIVIKDRSAYVLTRR